jgi:hypothetical protein
MWRLKRLDPEACNRHVIVTWLVTTSRTEAGLPLATRAGVVMVWLDVFHGNACCPRRDSAGHGPTPDRSTLVSYTKREESTAMLVKLQ